MTKLFVAPATMPLFGMNSSWLTGTTSPWMSRRKPVTV